MNTTKIVVALEIPNQIIAKIAQIAEETVFNTGNDRFEKFAGALVCPKHDTQRQPDQRGKDKADRNAP